MIESFFQRFKHFATTETLQGLIGPFRAVSVAGMSDGKQTITYQLAFEEVRRLMLRDNVLNSKFLMTLAGMIAVGVSLIYSGDGLAGLLAIIMALAVFAGVANGTCRLARSQFWRMEPKTVVFDDQRFTGTGSTVSVSLLWTQFKAFKRDAEYFYLRMPDDAIICLPHRAFEENQKAVFIQYAERGTLGRCS